MKNFPFWPAKIASSPTIEEKVLYTVKGSHKKKSSISKKAQHYVFFLGSHNSAWITDENIVLHSSEMLKNISKIKSTSYLKAIDEIVEASASTISRLKTGKKEDYVENDKSIRNSTSLRNLKKITKTPSITDDGLLKKPTPRFTKRSRTPKQKIKREKTKKSPQKENLTEETSDKALCTVPKLSVLSDDDSALISNAPANTNNHIAVIQPLDDQSMVEHENIKKSRQKRTLTEASNKGKSPARKLPKKSNDSILIPNAPTNNTYNEVTVIQPPDDRSTVAQEVFELPPGPSYDLSRPSTSTTVNDRNIKPTSKKIGFIGLGTMGQRIVGHLLNSRHDVSVWNRTPEKCKHVVEAGARKFLTPAELVRHCDIIFCCLSGPRASKSVIYQEDGILQGLEECEPGTKSYIEMTSMLPETSQIIAEAVTQKGGRYLEAPMVGSSYSAENGTLIIHGAGDHEVFCSCSTVFSAICKRTFYISSDIGSALKLNIVFRAIWDISYTPLLRTMEMIRVLGLTELVSDFESTFGFTL
ncbi:hypothetical protein TNCT_628851 [Trichonephila clavata]|uniref:PWWP domain-containing protein n=1 Tax=Trichonephila clavata TaxID=2740835 RepID=A0A8X6GQV5_TRICU|nr:hypothetical protein TNCT_628851 [Trichonephila clavata]